MTPSRWPDRGRGARKPITLHITGVIDVEGGEVSGWREYCDNADLAAELGIDVARLVATARAHN